MRSVCAGRDWDAETYDRVADPQLWWGLEVLDRLKLRGDETVLDAGCGTGRITLRLVERLPRGRVIGVDASPSMVERARATLGERAEVRLADLSELELEEPVDAVFSSAVFHWIPDHDRLFQRLHDALRPGGRLVAQCGGAGNVARLGAVVRELAGEPPFCEHLGDGATEPWNFRSPSETERSLGAAGFAAPRCWLEPKPVAPARPREFLSTVTLGWHLSRLPEPLRDRFLDAAMERMPEPLTLDYVRLNIAAERAAEGRPA